MRDTRHIEGGAVSSVRRALGRGVVAALAAVALVAVLVASHGDDVAMSRLATADSPPEGALVCDPLAPDHPSCVYEPNPTSTTIDRNEISEVTTPSTTTPSVPLPLPSPLRLEGNDASLRVTADFSTTSTLTGELVRLDVTIAERQASTASGVNFGDGGRYGLPGVPAVACGKFTTSTVQTPERQTTETFSHAYRIPGQYRVKVKVVSGDCTDDREVVLTGTVVVGPGGPSRSNGPLPPVVVGARQLTVPPTSGNTVRLNVHVRDPDGYLNAVTVKWGDGREETKQYSLADCIDPKNYWPGPTADAFTLEHAYSSSGPFEVEVVVSSSGCAGGDAQSANKTTTVTASE